MSEMGTTTISNEEYVELLEIKKGLNLNKCFQYHTLNGRFYIYGNVDEMDEEIREKNNELGKLAEDRYDEVREKDAEIALLKNKIKKEKYKNNTMKAVSLILFLTAMAILLYTIL